MVGDNEGVGWYQFGGSRFYQNQVARRGWGLVWWGRVWAGASGDVFGLECPVPNGEV